MPDLRLLITDRILAKGRSLVDRTMDYKCTVKRGSVPAATNGYNQPGKPGAWTTVVGDVDRPCDLNNQTVTVMTGEQQDKNRAMVITRTKLDFPYGSDITIKDRVYDLKYRDDTLVDSTVQYWEIKELIPDEFLLSFAIEAIH